MLSSQSHEPINLTVVHIAKCIRSTWLCYWIEVLNSTVTEESVVICTLFKFRTSLHKKLLIRALNLCVGTGAKIEEGCQLLAWEHGLKMIVNFNETVIRVNYSDTNLQ